MTVPLIPLFASLLRGAAAFGVRPGIGAALLRGAQAGVGGLLGGTRRAPPPPQPPAPPPSPSAFPASMHRHQSNYVAPAPAPPPVPMLSLMSSVGLGGMKLGASLALASKAVTTFAEILNNRAVEGLRVFNTNIANLAARKEIFGIQQSIRRGRLVEGTTTRLGDALMNLQEQAQPYQAFGENLTNAVLTGFTKLTSLALGTLESIGLTELIRNANSWFGGKKVGDNRDILSWLMDAKFGSNLPHEAHNRSPSEAPGARI